MNNEYHKIIRWGNWSNVLQHRRVIIVYNNKHFKISRKEEFKGSQHRIDNFEELEIVITFTCSIYIINMYSIIILCHINIYKYYMSTRNF